MTNFWIAVVLSVITAMIYIWSSVRQQKTLSKDVPKGKVLPWLILPALFLVAAPIGYKWLGNADKQINWQSAVEEVALIQSGQLVANKNINIQDLILGLRTSIQKEPKNGQLWFMLAESYFQLRMIDLADAAMGKALKIEPKPDWLVANAQILSLRSSAADVSKSLHLLQNALLIQPEHQSALLTLGFIYYKQQQFELAIENWERLLFSLKKTGGNTLNIQRQIDFAKQQIQEKSSQESE